MHEKSFPFFGFYSIQWIRKLIFIPPSSISRDLICCQSHFESFQINKNVAISFVLFVKHISKIHSNKRRKKWKSFKPLKFVGKCNSCTSRNGWEEKKIKFLFIATNCFSNFQQAVKYFFLFQQFFTSSHPRTFNKLHLIGLFVGQFCEDFWNVTWMWLVLRRYNLRSLLKDEII